MDAFPGWQRICAFAGSLAAACVATVAAAQTAPPFAQLLRETNDAPRVGIIEADIDRAQGLARQARARPNPEISVYGENFGGSSPYRGFDQTETTVQYNQPLELGGKRSARIAAGDAAVVAAQARGVQGRIDFALDLARAYAAVEVANRRIDIAEDEVEEATDDLKVARALVGAGKEARLRQLQAETELGTLQSDLDGARATKTAALARLSALAGSNVTYVDISDSLLDRLAARPATGPIDPLQSASYLAAQADQQAAMLHVTAERKKAIPNVTAQIGVRRLEVTNTTALVAGIAVPLNLFDRNRGNIAAAEAEQRGAEARAQAARLEAEANARAAVALIEAADTRAASADRTMKTAEETYRLARIAYEAGKAPLIELLAARHGLGMARGVIIDAATARFDARAMLARLKGLTITGEPVQ
ncbi:MAG TPA: TolC family protein [Sphingobium sp.]|uniref:TolC family protein n=1 Tax=Sphingobium sp. TaxID=1912891 RepID=UPI002ED613AF